MNVVNTKIYKKSFSLIETSMVIAVLAVLTFVSVRNLNNVFHQTNNKIDTERIQNVKTALQTYFNTHGYLPAPADYTLVNNDANYGKSKTSKSSYDGYLDSDFFYTNADVRILPHEYQEVEYIEGTGTQWVDTGYKPNNKTKIIMDMAFISENPNTAWSKPFGSYDSSYVYFMQSNHESGDSTMDNKFSFSCGKNQDPYRAVSSIEYILGNRYVIKTSNCSIQVNNSISYASKYGNFNVTNNLIIFATNSINGVNNQKAYMKLYSFKIIENASVIRDFVPCYRKSDGIIGLYDMVSKTFFTNKGSGTFLKGSNKNFSKINIGYTIYRGIVPFKEIGLSEEDVIDSKGNFLEYYVPEIMTIPQNTSPATPTNNLTKNGYIIKKLTGESKYQKYPCPAKKGAIPSGTCTETTADLYGVEFLTTETQDNAKIPSAYQEIEYIESTGNQWIDTGYKANTDTQVILKISLPKATTTSWRYPKVFSSTGSEGNQLMIEMDKNLKTFQLICGLNAGQHKIITPSPTYSYSNIDIYTIKAYNCGLDINGITKLATKRDSYNSSSNLAIFSLTPSGAQTNNMRLYFFQILENDNIIMDFIPCYRKSDGVTGLYDKVSGNFFANKGSVAFLIGRELNTPTTRKIYYNQPPYGLRVKDVKSNNEIEPNGSIAYLLVSHGEDGDKTCSIKQPKTIGQSPVVINALEDASKINLTNKFEAQNCFNAVKQDTYNLVARSDFLTSTNKEYMFYKGEKNADFDDIVEYSTLAELIKDGGGVNY